jgi:lipid-binding SYLF domain-containing protein
MKIDKQIWPFPAEMRKGIQFVSLVLLALLAVVCPVWAADREASNERLERAGKVMTEIMAAPDNGIPEEVLAHARCIAVVPHMLKGGLVFGAENGRGVATCRIPDSDHPGQFKGWSAPAFFAISGGSWGLQIGVEGIDLVMVIQNDRGMQQLLSSKFELGGDISAAAGPVGRHASADTNWKLDTEILTYSRAKGIFAGLTLNGAAIRRDDSSMNALYGHEVTNHAVLTGQVTPPSSAEPFLNAVRGAKAQSVEEQKN